MAFESLSNTLQDTFRKMRGQANLSEKNISDALNDIKFALLEADVSLEVINTLLDQIKKEAIGQDVLRGVDPSEMFVKVVHDKLIEILGSETQELVFEQKPGILMMVGLQGSGKTTSIAKIAHFLKTKQDKKVLLVAADLDRPAAVEQLQILGKQIDVDVYYQEDSNPLSVVKGALKKASTYDVVLIDTAGRLQIDEALMKQVIDIEKIAKPDEVLLSVDAMSGQDVINVAKGFKESLNLSGLVATKFDGDARGGAILSVRHMSGVPVKFVGVGENIEDLDPFHPDRVASRILGMGDVVSLVEKAQEKMDLEAAEKSAERLMRGEFTLEDMLVQLKQVSKMGPLSGIMKMLPGQMGQMANQINDQEAQDQLKKTEAIISSMTPEERKNPEIIRAGRRNRIAKGSGVSTTDVNRLLNQFKKMEKQMRAMSRMFG